MGGLAQTRADGFRAELQGLRAVAVLLVLAFHLWPGTVTGGFVGVDVFFVLSGYLITSHLAAEAARTGGIALRQFWARRIRRLLPAASVVLVACFVLMIAIVPQSLWQRTVGEIAASALYGENWILVASAVDYLGAENVPTLVQHYWSLSVEEQFYFIWPLLFVAGLAVRRLRLVLSIILVGSLALSILDTSAGSYFSTVTRAWEFAAGGLLALLPAATSRLGRTPWFASAVSWAGAALIVGSALAYTAATPFPGHAAIVPVIGTVLVIAGGAGSRWSAARLLSLRPAVVIGDLSYAIYLWHWPLVIVAPYLFGPDYSDFVRVGIAVASVLLAVATKWAVEDRFRQARVWHAPRRSFGLAAATIAVIIASSTITTEVLDASSAAAARQAIIDFETKPCYGAAAIVDSGCPDPFAVPSGMASAFAPVDKGSLAKPCDSSDVEIVRCEFGQLDDPVHTIALVGNSHAGALVAGLEEYAETVGWKIILMRKTGCVGASTHDLTTTYDPECTAWTRAVLSTIASSPEIDIVIFATNNRSSRYLGAADAPVDVLRANIAENLAALVAAGKTVVAIGDVPASPVPAPECVDLHHLEYDPCATPRMDGEESGNIVAEAARQTPGVHVIDILPYLCDAARCHVIIGGVVVYIDEHHLSASFSRSLGPHLGADIGRLLPVAPPPPMVEIQE